MLATALPADTEGGTASSDEKIGVEAYTESYRSWPKPRCCDWCGEPLGRERTEIVYMRYHPECAYKMNYG